MSSPSRTDAKAEAFRALHEGPPFLIPNPWDVGSARVLEALGFPALATTSSGLAFALGRRDGGATLDEVTRHVADLDDTIARLQAFEQAGADVLYAPGLRTHAEIREICSAVSKPVNVLALPMLSVGEILDAGAQRISVGGGLTWVAVKAMADAATAMRDDGDLSALAARVPLAEWLPD